MDEHDFTFMGRLLRHILNTMSKGYYLDSLSSWYDIEGSQIFGLRFIHFLHENLGTSFLQGFDKLLVYNIVSELRHFYRDYGLLIGGGNISKEVQEKFFKKENKILVEKLIQADEQIGGNYESLSGENVQTYINLSKVIPPQISQKFNESLQKIGKLQLLRKLVTRQIHFAAKVESTQYTNCLETLNSSVLHNL